MSDDLWSTYSAVIEAILENPLVFLVQIFLTACAVTRAWTQFRSVYRREDAQKGTQAIPRVPYWIPLLANTPSFSLNTQSWLLNQTKAYASGAFALNLSGRDYIVITTPELLDQLTKSSMSISSRPYEDLRSRYFFANRQVTSKARIRVQSATLLDKDTLYTKKIIQQLQSHAYNFISPSASWVDQAQWERGAEVKVLETSPILSVSASFTTLVRDFASQIMFSAILGPSFIDANPGFVNDFFAFSAKYSTFMTGLPYWIAPGLGPPALAREKCLIALDGLVNSMVAETEGKSGSHLGTGLLYDLYEVLPAIRELVRQVKQEYGQQTATRTISCEILEVIFGKVFYSVNMVLWMLIYLFMEGNENKTTLSNIRREAKNMVEVVKAPPSGLPFQDPPRLNFKNLGNDQRAFKGKCPILEAALSEVCRLETEFERYFAVEQDSILEANVMDHAREDGTQKGQKIPRERIQLLKGDRIYAAYGAVNKDSKSWDRPRRFVPGRFAQTVDPPIDTTPDRFSHGSQYEAGLDIVYILLALLSFYDISKLDGEGLSHPGTSFVAGMGLPKGDPKVRISRLPI